MANDENKGLQQRFLEGDIFVGNEHLMPTSVRKPMPTTAPTPPPPAPPEGKTED
ncbi:hypothetical protein [Pseudomonas lundensis]|uniref:hypothetical protein n=1 Tax=Pseudomonas lundensis TaxID=86185 RepID=UPI000AFAB72D|nr:hypothetical protein [Pseudomonas lundensis]